MSESTASPPTPPAEPPVAPPVAPAAELPIAPPAEPPVAPPLTEVSDGWRHVHRATPLLRGGVFILALIGALAANLRDRLIALFVPGAEGEFEDDLISYLLNFGAAVLLTVGIAVLVLIIVAFYLSWRMRTYRVTADLVEERSGIIFRQHRQARLDRIQSIDVVRPTIARLFGLGRVKFVGAGQAALELAYLPLAQAEALRMEVLQRASGAGAGDDPEDLSEAKIALDLEHGLDRAAEPSLLRVPNGRIVAAALLNLPFLILMVVGISFLLYLILVLENVRGWLPLTFVPALIAAVGFVGSRILSQANYHVVTSGQALRLSSGLLTRRSETLPPGRAHAIRVQQPLLWRRFGWWSVEITRANQLQRSSGGQSQVSLPPVLPVGSREDAIRMVQLLLPELAGADAALLDGLLGEGGGGYVASPKRMRIRRWFGLHRSGIRVDRTAVWIRSGALRRRLTLVPLARIQSVGLKDGPVLRRQHGAHLAVHIVPGPIVPRMRALDAQDAEQMLLQLRAASIHGIAIDRSHRWQEQRS